MMRISFLIRKKHMTNTEIENTIRKAAFYAEIARTELDRLQRQVPEDALNSDRRESRGNCDES